MEVILVLSSLLSIILLALGIGFYQRWKQFTAHLDHRLDELEDSTVQETVIDRLSQQLQQVQQLQRQMGAQIEQQWQWIRQLQEQQQQVLKQLLDKHTNQLLERSTYQVSALQRQLEQWYTATTAAQQQQLQLLEPQQKALSEVAQQFSKLLEQSQAQQQIFEQLEMVLDQLRSMVQQQIVDGLQQQEAAFQRLFRQQTQLLRGFFSPLERDVDKLLAYTREFGKLSKVYQQWSSSVGKHIQSTLQNLRRIHHQLERLSKQVVQPLPELSAKEEKPVARPQLVDAHITQGTLTAEIASLLRELRSLHDQLRHRSAQVDSQYLSEVEDILVEMERSTQTLLERLDGAERHRSDTRIFVLEDSRMFREHLEYILERQNYQLLFASTIAEARQILDQEVPDLLLLDIELPDGDGLQLCRELRKRKEFKECPILFISSLTDKETKVQGFQAGADDYVPKPFDELELLARIERHLELARSRQSLEEGLFSLVRILEGTLQLQHILVKLLQQLAEARYAAEQANRAKSTFLASMSHELRTPLNAILGFAQILRQDPNLAPKQREYVETMYRSGNHLLEMINDILDLSKIEAGKIQLLPVDIELAQFVEDLRGMFHLRCQEKGLWLKFEVDPQLPQYIVADAQKLRQVLINLIGNAIKFTAQGGITVRVRQVTDSEGKPRIRWEVEDTGRGIPKEQLEKIMEPFHQVEAMVSEGTGLGLTISKALVALMEGQLQVRSRVGQGSVFFFDLPLKTPVAGMPQSRETAMQAAASMPQRHMAAKPATVLIVDDSRTNRKILREFLAGMNITCVEAEDGWKAWKLIQDPQHAFDVVLTDIVMPEMNGIELVKRIRSAEQEQEGEHLPIIGITASVLQLSDEELLEIGFDAVLHKPFKLEDLVRLLQEKTSIELVEVEEQPVETEASVTPEEIQQWFSELPEAVQEQLTDAMLVQDLDAIATVLSSLEPEHPVVQFLQQKVQDGDVVYFSKLSMQLT